MQFLKLLCMSILISLSCSYIIMTFSIYRSNEVMNGQELLEEVVIAILLGVAISIVSLIFRLEKISFLVQLLLHFLAIMSCVFIAGYFGNWYDVTNKGTLAFILIVTLIIYGGTWCFLQYVLREDIAQINQTIEKRRGEAK